MSTESFIPGKDASLESTIHTMQQKLATRGFVLDESSWLNPVESIWSVHVRDRECPMRCANGEDATREGCDWIRHFQEMKPARYLVYRCIESLMNLGDADNFNRALTLLYGAATVRQAQALLDRSERFFGLHALGPDMEGSAMHQTLLAAYDKLFAVAAA